MKSALSAPQPLAAEHERGHFSCGEPSLDDWLKRRALPNQFSGASRTFVVCNARQQVVGYYALAAGAVSHALASTSIRRNMPDPVPVLILARLAVAEEAQGRQLGLSLLRDAVRRARHVAENAGIRAILVHALNERARDFYIRYGFSASPIDPMTLILRLQQHDQQRP